MSQFPSSRRGPPTSTGLLLVGVGRCADGALAPIDTVRESLISWFMLAARLGLSLDGLAIACDPPLGLADLAVVLARRELPRAERRAAWSLFVRHALHGGPAGEALERARALSAGWAPMVEDELPPALQAWRALLARHAGPAAASELQPATRLVLDAYAGAARPVPRLAALELAAPAVFGEAVAPALRVARTAADLIEALHQRGWTDPGEDPHCAALVALLSRADREAAEPLASDQDASWSRLADAVLALDPEQRDQTPTRAAVLGSLRGLASRCRGGLVVFCGHEGRAGGLPVLGCADPGPAAGGLGVGEGAFDPRGLITVDDLAAALGDQARGWTVALDTQHPGGFGGPTGEPHDWTRRGLAARVLSATGEETPIPAGGPRALGALTWSVGEVLRRWPAVQDGPGRAMGLSNGDLIQRANLLMEGLSTGQRVSLVAPEPVGDLPFLGVDPATRLFGDPDDQSDPFELWPGSDEIIGVEVLSATGVRKLIVFATRELTRFAWASDLNAVTSHPGWKLRVTLSTDIERFTNTWSAWAQQSASGLRQESGTSPSGGIFAQNTTKLTPVAKKLDNSGRKISFSVSGDALRVFIDQPPGGNGLLSPGWFGVSGPDQGPRVVLEGVAAGWRCGSFLDLLS